MTDEMKKKLLDNMTENLQMLRVKLGLTQNELGEMLGMSRHTIMNIENRNSELIWNNFLALVFLFIKNEGTDKLLNLLKIYTDEFNDYIKQRKPEGKADESATTERIPHLKSDIEKGRTTIWQIRENCAESDWKTNTRN